MPNPNQATLVWWGRKRREWGFHTASGWTYWRGYFAAAEAALSKGGEDA